MTLTAAGARRSHRRAVLSCEPLTNIHELQACREYTWPVHTHQQQLNKYTYTHTTVSAASFPRWETRYLFQHKPWFYPVWWCEMAWGKSAAGMNEWMNVKVIKVSKMTSRCAGTEQVKKSEIEIRKREETGFEMRTKGREKDWGAVMWYEGLFHRRADTIGNGLSPTVYSRMCRTTRDIDEAERNRCLASVSGMMLCCCCSHLHWRPWPMFLALSDPVDLAMHSLMCWHVTGISNGCKETFGDCQYLYRLGVLSDN